MWPSASCSIGSASCDSCPARRVPGPPNTARLRSPSRCRSRDSRASACSADSRAASKRSSAVLRKASTRLRSADDHLRRRIVDHVERRARPAPALRHRQNAPHRNRDCLPAAVRAARRRASPSVHCKRDAPVTRVPSPASSSHSRSGVSSRISRAARRVRRRRRACARATSSYSPCSTSCPCA